MYYVVDWTAMSITPLPSIEDVDLYIAGYEVGFSQHQIAIYWIDGNGHSQVYPQVASEASPEASTVAEEASA